MKYNQVYDIVTSTYSGIASSLSLNFAGTFLPVVCQAILLDTNWRLLGLKLNLGSYPRVSVWSQGSTLETRQWRERRIIEVVEVATNSTGWDAGTGTGNWRADSKPASWLEESLKEEPAPIDLPNLMALLNTLGSQLSALQTTLQRSGLLTAEVGPRAYPQDSATIHTETVYTDRLVEQRAGAQGLAPLHEDAVIRVSLLGPFQLHTGDRSLGQSIPRQVRTVLEYLLSQGRRPTSKDALLDLLWPDANPTVACSRLRVVMHTLRKSIPCDGLGFHDLVVMTGNNFIINPDAKLRVDVEEFEQRWLKGWRLAKLGHTQESLAEYEQAEALYTGDYLEDEPYADWTLLRREALRDAYANILTMLAAMSLESCDYTGAIIWSQKLLAQDNCREDAYRLLMTSHQKLGQPSRAAHWYDLCAWALQRELGMEPSTETRELYSQLRAVGD